LLRTIMISRNSHAKYFINIIQMMILHRHRIIWLEWAISEAEKLRR
jgi:hypothetical protein